MAGNGARKRGKRTARLLGNRPQQRGSLKREKPGEGHSKRGEMCRALRPATTPALQGPFPGGRKGGAE
eukprot:11324009-Heterocapsa_arctica.AAC.1